MNTEIENQEDITETIKLHKEEDMNTNGIQNYSYDNVTTVERDQERSFLENCINEHAWKNNVCVGEGVVCSRNDFEDLRDDASDGSGNDKGDVYLVLFLLLL